MVSRTDGTNVFLNGDLVSALVLGRRRETGVGVTSALGAARPARERPSKHPSITSCAGLLRLVQIVSNLGDVVPGVARPAAYNAALLDFLT